MGTYHWTEFVRKGKPRLRLRYGYWICGLTSPGAVWVVGLTPVDAYQTWVRCNGA